MTDQEDKDMTEQKYLELAQDFKTIMDEKEEEIKKIKAELNDFKFVMYKVLGITSFCSEIFDSMDELGVNGQTMEHNLEYLNNQIMLLLQIH